MSQAAKLKPLSPNPKPGGMEDMRAYGERASDFLLEIREYLLTLDQGRHSTTQIIARIDYFLLNDTLPEKTN